MKKILNLFIILFLLSIFLMGCISDESTIQNQDNVNHFDKEIEQEINQLKNEIVQLKNKINEKDKQLLKLEEQIHTKNTQNDWSQTLNSRRIDMLSQIVMNQKIVTVRQAIIKDVNSNGEDVGITLDCAQLIHDENAPNGIRVKNENEETVKIRINKNLANLYILKKPHQISSSNFQNLKDHIQDFRLFSLYFVEDELVLIKEEQLP
ncbi:hypothetical protein E3U55_04500 [Filobacillus milosensis]|uniref:Uncharacterized protein n=1 Tax=Filobacillus milosensis TaxID=94137 RepID=A0A4Y8IR68_9BACI|nr:hypothetical protein [Filobacillus milosensis]TFB24078.1 hypothetical protein E3U55_04500 [Filobacillus milosensis]